MDQVIFHERHCRRDIMPVCIRRYGDRLVCLSCRRTNIEILTACKCVENDDPEPRIQTSDGTTVSNATGGLLHYYPTGFSPLRECYVCPRECNYQRCRGGIKHPDCLQLVTYNTGGICEKCTHLNRCKQTKCIWNVYDDHPATNIAIGVCDRHYVFTCQTCKIECIDPINAPRVQCRECDAATNTIVCCGAVHRPHTLSYHVKHFG
jgi:hypothetical protein